MTPAYIPVDVKQQVRQDADFIVATRRLWAEAGWWPPTEDQEQANNPEIQ